jgi:predicted amidophosphoribosyltransferase
MPQEAVETIECPYCKEEIRAGAVLCKHCGSRLGARPPEHGGVCPYCKEAIHPEATRCKHCGSNLEVREAGGCGCPPRGAPRFVEPQRLAMRRGGYPDPECFHECFWRCVDSTGDAEWCWRACAWICPPAVVSR